MRAAFTLVSILILLMVSMAPASEAASKKERVNAFYSEFLQVLKQPDYSIADVAALLRKNRSVAKECLDVLKEKAETSADKAETFRLLQQKLEVGMLLASQDRGCSESALERLQLAAAAEELKRNRLLILEHAVRLCPKSATAHYRLADTLRLDAAGTKDFTPNGINRGNKLLDKAIEHYQTALKQDKALFGARLGLARAYGAIGLYEKARNEFETAFKLKPSSKEADSGLMGVGKLIAAQSDGFKNAEQIVKKVGASKTRANFRTMGIANETAVRERLRFNKILFNESSATINRKEALEQLAEIGKALSDSKMAEYRFVVEGHASKTAGFDRNMRLSRMRADAVKRHLVEKHGVDAEKIVTQGFGYTRPRFPHDYSKGGTKNRRVEILFVRDGDE
ncbi:OmpA family protein [Thermodesulfobacteriota bacterium]